MQVQGRRLFWWRGVSLVLFLGLGGLVGCFSEEFDESTRKVHKMTESFDIEEKYLGLPLKIDQIDFPGAPGVMGPSYKLKLFLRGSKGIGATPGNPKAPKGIPGTGAIGRGYEMEIMAALNGGKPPLATNSADPPYGMVFMLDANAMKSINKAPRVETILVLFRNEGTPEKKGRNRLISDLVRFGAVPKYFDLDAPESKDKFVSKKLEPVFKEYMFGHSKAINAEELITDSATQLPDGRSQVWFTYLVPVNQKAGANTFVGTMSLSYRVTWAGKGAPIAAPSTKGTAGAPKTKGGKDAEVVFDSAKKSFQVPEPVKRSIATLRMGKDVDKALELYNYRSGGGGAGSGTSAAADSGSAGGSGSNTKSK